MHMLLTTSAAIFYMADIENPVAGGGLVADATPMAADGQSDCGLMLCVACMVGALMAVCVLPVLFYDAHRTAGLGVLILAVALLGLGLMGLVVAGCCCVVIASNLIWGNIEGTQQRDEED